ncbi:quinone-dependent dihydroorotate dehydrogenase [Paenalcaligenes hominis]|uniref:quinone-dependent dihydroorotate dehydrogenase n=1 Tax=Paenalcaligenes hominis TaxID=643674 RepID=UPI003524B925
MSLLLHTYGLVRPLLFKMDAEQAHEFTLKALDRVHQLAGSLLKQDLSLPTELMGLSLKNPVGLAAGLDKNGAHIDALGALGFGFVEVGTVTPLAQSGNPKPRLFRIPAKQSLINRFGFNNQGLDQFIQNVKQSQWHQHGGILGLNIGKNAATPIEEATSDYLKGLDGVYPHADYVTVNISSPNTQNLRALQAENELIGLLSALNERRQALQQQYQRYVPIVVKIAPDLSIEQIDSIAHAVQQTQIDGIIATNTTLTRDAVAGQPHANEQGGLSGPAVHALSLEVLARLRAQLGADYPLIGVGGIYSGLQAVEKFQAGANAVQIYTGLIYQGPLLIRDCVDALRNLTR